MYKKLRDHWSEVDTSAPIETIPIDDRQLQQKLLKFYDDILESGDSQELVRGDYREVAELARMLIGGKRVSEAWSLSQGNWKYFARKSVTILWFRDIWC